MLVARNTTNKYQEPCSSTSSHLLVFPKETSRVQNPSPNYWIITNNTTANAPFFSMENIT